MSRDLALSRTGKAGPPVVLSSAPESLSFALAPVTGLGQVLVFYALIFLSFKASLDVPHVLKLLTLVWPYLLIAIALFAVPLVAFLRYRHNHLALNILGVDDHCITIGRFEDRASDAYDYQVFWRELKSVRQIGSKIYFETSANVTYQIKESNAYRWVTRDELIAALIKYAPDATVDLKLPDSHDHGQAYSYTNLWLQNINAVDRRKRKGPLDAGETLADGKYTIVKTLGVGGQGRAYLAEARADGRADVNLGDRADSASETTLVVLKEYVLPDVAIDLSGESSAYRTEASILAGLDYPGIERLIDCFDEDLRSYLVVEYIPGVELRLVVARSGSLPEPTVIDLALMFCDTLAYLHGRTPPVVHGDFTPENILLLPDGQVKLVDFTEAHYESSVRSDRVSGKQGYIAPEQYAGLNLTQSDIYTLGCTMYFLLTRVDCAPLHQPRVKDGYPGVSDELDNIVARCMAVDLSERYHTAGEVKRELMVLRHSV